MTREPAWVRFVPQDEIVERYRASGQSIPPSIVFTPYVVRDGVEGYLVPCKADDPDAEPYRLRR